MSPNFDRNFAQLSKVQSTCPEECFGEKVQVLKLLGV